MKKLIVIIITLIILLAAVLYFFYPDANRQIDSKFSSFGPFAPAVSPVKQWKTVEYKNEQGKVILKITMPEGQFVDTSAMGGQAHKYGYHNSMIVEVHTIPEYYPQTIKEFYEVIKLETENKETDIYFGKIGKEIDAIYLYNPGNGLKGNLIVYVYIKDNIVTFGLDYSPECYFLERNVAAYGELPIEDPERCQDYHKTYALIAERVVSSIRFLPSEQNIPAGKVNLYSDKESIGFSPQSNY